MYKISSINKIFRGRIIISLKMFIKYTKNSIWIIAFSFLMFGSSVVKGIAVEQWKWGFTGNIVKNHINPLSVMLSNPAPIPFDGMIALQKMDQLGMPLGAPLVRKIFLGPYASKWVQFYPFIRNKREEWRLSWGKNPNQSSIIKVSVSNGRSVIFLTDTADTFVLNGRIRIPAFPEKLFPPTVSAMDGLAAVVITTPPRFTPLQKQAFKDWINAGGKVYIPDTDGDYPVFGSEFHYLNFSGKKQNIGAGEVIHYHINDIMKVTDIDQPSKVPIAKNRIYTSDLTDYYFRSLRSQLQTHHNWALIFLISAIYGILITVVNFIIGRKSSKVWKPIIFFVVTVTLFSLLLAWCGRRGYGEKSHIFSLTYARELEPGRFDTTQWLDLFVTDGGYYKIQHPNMVNLYSDCRTMNAINGQIYNGFNGYFVSEIPLFSSMQLYHRGAVTLKKSFTVKTNIKLNGNNLDRIVVNLSENFPKKVLAAAVILNKQVYTLSKTGANNKVYIASSASNPVSISKYLRDWNDTSGTYRFYNNENISPEKMFKNIVPPLIIRSRGGNEIMGEYYPTACARDNKADIYILAQTPKDFYPDRSVIKKQEGYTLFHFTEK